MLQYLKNRQRGGRHALAGTVISTYMNIARIFNYVQGFADGRISRSAFWELSKFKHPTYQISFHTIAVLRTLKYIGEDHVYGKE